MHGLPAPLLPKSRILFAGSKLCGFRSFKVEKVGYNKVRNREVIKVTFLSKK